MLLFGSLRLFLMPSLVGQQLILQLLLCLKLFLGTFLIESDHRLQVFHL